MRINSVSCVHNNISFQRLNSQNKVSATEHAMSVEDKITLGTQGLAVIGIAGAVLLVLKENNINLIKIAKRSIRELGKIFETKKHNQTVLDLLDGRRDEEGVRIYKTYIAGIKRKSLARKFLNGELKDKDSRAFHYIAENSLELQRITGAI